MTTDRERHYEERCVGWRALVVTVVITMLFSVVSFRLMHLQLMQHDALKKDALARCRRSATPMACRGTIFDRNGEPLAKDHLSYRIEVDKLRLLDLNSSTHSLAKFRGVSERDIRSYIPPDARPVENLKEVCGLMGRMLGKNPADIQNAIEQETKKNALTLDYQVEAVEIQKWRDALAQYRVNGIVLREAYDRHYTLENRLTHVVGFMRKDEKKGVEGIEGGMNRYLSGSDGKKTYFVDGRGREIERDEAQTQPSKPGNDITLTVDMQLQAMVEEVMERFCHVNHPERMVVILGNPLTGEIYSMASRPHFTRGEDNKVWPMNSAIAAAYEPGSIFKLPTYSGVFDKGLVGLTTVINTNGGYFKVPNTGKKVVALRDDKPLAEVSVRNGLAFSSNIAAYKLAKFYLGMDDFYHYVTAFGFGKKTGIQLLHESPGHVPKRPWNTTDESRYPIGYALQITPLQAWCMVSTVANGGLLLKPLLVTRVTNQEGRTMEEFTTEEVRRVISPQAAHLVTEAMIEVIASGTGIMGAVPGFTTAGKTGTARHYNPKLQRYDDGYTVSFIGFLPARRPRLSIAVMIEKPTVPQAFGGKTAGPVFSEILRRAADHLRIQPEANPENAPHPPQPEAPAPKPPLARDAHANPKHVASLPSPPIAKARR